MKNNPTHLLSKAIICVGLILFSNISHAMKIKIIKANKILIDLENEQIKIGDIVMNASSTATAEILQARPGQAVALIKSGEFQVNQILKVTPKATIQNPVTNSNSAIKTVQVKKRKDQDSDIIYRHDLVKIAVLAKFMSNTIATKQSDNTAQPLTNIETVKMTGFNPGLFVSLDYPGLKWITLRGTLGFEVLSVAGQAQFNSCNNKTSTDCNAQINYFSGAALARYDFYKGQQTYWAAAGGALKFPMSKSSTSLREDDISLANSLILSFGLDYSINNKYFIPVSFEYHYSLNTSDTVPEISQMALQAGYGMQF